MMLSDAVRVNAYQQAIKKLVTSNDSVLDLGTGTGILALLAMKNKPKKIYAIDHSDIINAARAVARQNSGYDIEFLKVNSKEFNSTNKVSVILHEQIGFALFDERIVDNITELRDRVLKAGGKIIPARFDFFIEPMSLKDEYRVPFIWQLNLHGVRFDVMRNMNEDWANFETDGSLSGYMQQLIWPYEVNNLLCEPEKLFSIDLETMRKDDVPRELKYTKTVLHDGRLDVLGIYFRVNFDDEIFFDTSPLSPKTHFKNVCVRLAGEDLSKGDVIEFEWIFGDFAIPDTWKLKYKIKYREQGES
jgi:protein arginine N-methyltransferase 1